MEVGGGVVVFLFEGWDRAGRFQGFENTQCHERDDALAVGRVFPEFHCVGGGGGEGLSGVLSVECQGDGGDVLSAQRRVVGQVREG